MGESRAGTQSKAGGLKARRLWIEAGIEVDPKAKLISAEERAVSLGKAEA